MQPPYGLIAGSGFGEFGRDEAVRQVTTRFGPPAAPLRRLRYGKHAAWLLLRHGDAHSLAPHAINYRANLQALRQLGVRSVIGINTVGVIDAGIVPGQLVVPSQLIDYTWGRGHSIYEGHCATLEHVDMSEPFSAGLRQALLAAAAKAGARCHDGGVYAVTQGPRLETAAEVDRLERDGADIIGMTAMPEATIARELGMDYACLSLAVNFAAGRGEKSIHEDIDECTTTARTQGLQLLDAFFSAL